MKPLYLDYASSTPVDPRVEKAMRPYFLTRFGNPGSLHSFGQEAIAAVDRARETLAREIGADFREIVFTGSATEANNLALRGAVARWRKESGNKDARPRIVATAIEHESVLETLRDLEAQGVEVVLLPVNKEGFVKPEQAAAAVNENTVLVSVMYANNEIGSIQPIGEIGKAIRAMRGSGKYPLFHTDAAQAFQFLDCSVDALSIDMMTLSSHKMYGPKGAGALFVKRVDAARGRAEKTFLIDPMIAGGGQEFGLRSGTENVPLLAGFGAAAEIASSSRKKEAARLSSLRNNFIKDIKKSLRGTEVNGPSISNTSDASGALSNIINLFLPQRSAEDVIMMLDRKGIAISAGSACRARAAEPSYVIRALGRSEAYARSSVRISMGRGTSAADLRRLRETFLKILA